MVENLDIRIEISEIHTIEDLLIICNKLSVIVASTNDSIYKESWYRRHRKFEELQYTNNDPNNAAMMIKVNQQTLMHRKPNIFDDNNDDDNSCSIFSLLLS